MFATIVGALPVPAGFEPEADRGHPRGDDVLGAQLQAQIAMGIDLLSYAEPVRPSAVVVDGWRRAADLAAALGSVPVKAAILGPFSLGEGRPPDRAVAVAREAIDALAEAGCSLVEIHEPLAVSIGPDQDARRRFRATHERLADGTAVHLCLAITGGNADAAGAGTLLVPGYRSFLLDLILGPDNWRLAVDAPPTVGIVAGAIDHRPGVREVPETGVWAAHYAASTGGRGLDRVGLATAGSLAPLPWDAALARLAVLGKAARVAAIPRGEGLAQAIDPRALDIRSAAMGRYAPLRRRPKRSRRSRPG